MRPLSQETFNSYLRWSFSCIPVEVGDIEPEWAMFKASIAKAAAGSWGLKVIGTSRGGNPRTPWWTSVEEEEGGLLGCVIPEES